MTTAINSTNDHASMLTFSEAITEAVGLKKRGIVFYDEKGRAAVKVIVACGELFVCSREIVLERFTPDVRLATKPRWKATNDI